MDNENFKIEIIGRIIIVRLRGDIDMITATQFDDFMRCNVGKYETFIIDMSLVEYLNSTGIGVLLSHCKMIKIYIIPPFRKILIAVMQLMEVSKYVTLCENIKEAFDYIKTEV